MIFLSSKSKIRTDDFYKGDMKFEHVFINDGTYEERSKIKSLLNVAKIIATTKYKKLIFPGWEIKELFFLSFLTSKNSNCVVVESSILETRKSSLIWLMKKLFLSRMGIGLPSGNLQADIFRAMNFSGKIVHTNGVGVLNKNFYITSFKQNPDDVIQSNLNIKYIYVGRVAEEKNLDFLCRVMIEQKKDLTIVGYGPLEEELKAKYGKKVNFLGAIDNESLKEVYKQHQVFILPSKSEPWGLVVEEALCSGLPVIVSNMVGSKDELVENKKTGTVFDYDRDESLIAAIRKLENNYAYFSANVNKLDMQVLLNEKVDPYARLMNV